MSELKIAGNPLPGMPWEERPEGCKNVMWRCSANPIIPRDLLPTSNSIFNSAVVPFGEGYAGVFRCDDTNRRMALHVGFSKDAVHWDINPEKLQFQCDIPEIGEWVYGYDPRVCFIDDRYVVTVHSLLLKSALSLSFHCCVLVRQLSVCSRNVRLC